MEKELEFILDKETFLINQIQPDGSGSPLMKIGNWLTAIDTEGIYGPKQSLPPATASTWELPNDYWIRLNSALGFRNAVLGALSTPDATYSVSVGRWIRISVAGLDMEKIKALMPIDWTPDTQIVLESLPFPHTARIYLVQGSQKTLLATLSQRNRLKLLNLSFKALVPLIYLMHLKLVYGIATFCLYITIIFIFFFVILMPSLPARLPVIAMACLIPCLILYVYLIILIILFATRYLHFKKIVLNKH